MAKFAIMGYGTLGSGLAYVADVNHDSIDRRSARRSLSSIFWISVILRTTPIRI